MHAARIVVVALACCGLVAIEEPRGFCEDSKTTQPNILFILVDDLAWSDLACYGHPWHRTPNIDSIATRGLAFTNAYSPAPICSAARASILTGKAVPRLGFEFVTKNGPGAQSIDADVPLQSPPFTLNLPVEEVTIAERMIELGYETAFFGKWHVNQHYERRYLSWHPVYGPSQQGFGFAEEDFGDHPYAWKRGEQPTAAADGTFPADSMVQRVCRYLRDAGERPYFAMASSFYVHTPVRTRCRWLVEQYDRIVPRGIVERGKRLEYAAFVETLDHHVGQMLAALDESNQRDDTVVWFMSDNGGHPEHTGNGPLRGSKWNLYEGGVRVPMLVQWPRRVQPGMICEVPVIGYDLAASFTSIGGHAVHGTDGIDLTPLLEKPVSESSDSTIDQGGADQWLQRSLVWHFPYYHPETKFSEAIQEIGVDDFRVSQTRPQSAIRRGKWKALHLAESGTLSSDARIELYDLSTDPSEQVDLSQARPEIADSMRQALADTLRAMNARHAAPKK